MVIRSLPDGGVLELKDVANWTGSQIPGVFIGAERTPGANCMMPRPSGSNANEIIEEIDEVSPRRYASSPKAWC